LKEQQIPHEVPRSVCVLRPYKSNHEWRLLRDNDPSGWARAVEVDEALYRPDMVATRNLKQSMNLHRSSCRWPAWPWAEGRERRNGLRRMRGRCGM